MSKVWKIVGLIALIALVAGAVLAGVGFMTGANLSRVQDVLPADAAPGSVLGYVRSLLQSLLGIAPLG